VTAAQHRDVIHRDRGGRRAGTSLSSTTRLPDGPASQSTVEARRELAGQLRVVDIHRETAATLEVRAARSRNATVAVLLRDRAEQHRGTARKLLDDLALQGLLSHHAVRRPMPGPTSFRTAPPRGFYGHDQADVPGDVPAHLSPQPPSPAQRLGSS
jgi:hypothetical protein